ncbi:hypothetical protein OESDEN_01822 [Oesophagostomum dentatum]|uniref:non-specific serine/threonine protein kinase n=1 Tax=Oesophagostomum dentatum TaxID=61180 RepID=A0A0B1TQW3_OESDE|nr:hypothetical protein OESDEN_01822 [Oesophagostomum dentatum]
MGRWGPMVSHAGNPLQCLDEDSRDYSRYEILTKYNEGRYSALYIVAKQTCSDNEETLDKFLYAMKVGLRKESVNTILRFKRELAVLRELRNAGVFHTPCLYDSGRVCERYYIVMTLFDRNLEKLKECIKGNLRPSTIYYLASEALAAIEEVHAIGYIHRDIKPTNFCIGIYAAAARLYLVDFGEAVKNGKNIKYGVPDAFSLPYWAIDSHKKAAANPRVDLEAWFYTFAELQCPNLLTWKRCHVESDVLSAKTKFWAELETSVAGCSPQFTEAAKIIAKLHDKVDYEALKRLMEEGKTTNLKGAPLTLEWVKVMPKGLPKRAKPAAPPDPNRSNKSLGSKKAFSASPKRKQSAEDDKNSQAEEWHLSSTLMQKLRLRPKKGRKFFPFSGSSTASSGSSETSSDVSKKSEKVEAAGKLADEPKETLFQRLSLRKKRKPKQAAEAQQTHTSELPPPYATSGVDSKAGTVTIQAKPEPERKSETTPNLIQLLSFRGKKKSSDDRKDKESKNASAPASSSISKEAEKRNEEKGEVDVDPGKQVAPQSQPPKKEETFFQMISRRIRKKKRSTSTATTQSTSGSAEKISQGSGSAISGKSRVSEDAAKSSTGSKQEPSSAAPAETPVSKQATSCTDKKCSAESTVKKEKVSSKTTSGEATSVPKAAPPEKGKKAEEDTKSDNKGLTVAADTKGAQGSKEKSSQPIVVPTANEGEKSQRRGLIDRLRSLKKKASNSDRQLKGAPSISTTSSETKKSQEINKDTETRSVRDKMKKKAKGIWKKFMKKKDTESSEEGSKGSAENA